MTAMKTYQRFNFCCLFIGGSRSRASAPDNLLANRVLRAPNVPLKAAPVVNEAIAEIVPGSRTASAHGRTTWLLRAEARRAASCRPPTPLSPPAAARKAGKSGGADRISEPEVADNRPCPRDDGSGRPRLSRPLLAFIGVVPRAIEGRQRLSWDSRAGAVGSVARRRAADGESCSRRNGEGRGQSDQGDCLEQGFFSPTWLVREPSRPHLSAAMTSDHHPMGIRASNSRRG